MDLNSIAFLIVGFVFIGSLAFADHFRRAARAASEDNLELRRRVEELESRSLPTPYWASGDGHSTPYPFSLVFAASSPQLESYEDYLGRVLAKAVIVARREHTKATTESYR